jgi:hypothetical protein
MTLVEEGFAALRGCLRLLRGDPHALTDFNVTIEGIWRTFAVIIPQAVLAYPLFLSQHRLATEVAAVDGAAVSDLNLTKEYVYLVAVLALWPVAAAILTRVLGVSANFVRYVVVYNWMSLIALAIAVVPSLIHLAFAPGIEALSLLFIAVYLGLGVVSWIVARRALETTSAIAFAFVLADYALSIGLNELFGA